MPVPFELRVDDEVLACLPGLRLIALRFAGARMAAAGRKIEPLRDRVIAQARDRIKAARDARRIPSIAAFHRAFPELARGARRPWLDEAFRAIARRDPFPVVNDAADAGRLLALHYAVPVSSHDLAKVSGTLSLRLAPQGTFLKTPQGPAADSAGLPVLCDAAGPVGSPFFEVARTMPGRQSGDLAFVVYEPDAETWIDLEDLKTRASNWLTTLVGARLVGVVTSTGQP